MSAASDKPRLDLVFNKFEMPADVMALHDMRVEEGKVYIFDFDGVVCASGDNDIYRLHTWPGEEELLARAAAAFGLRCDRQDVNYRRHILMEAASCFLDIPLQPGPAFAHLQEACRKAYAYILTARSGWYAAQRARRFMTAHNIMPLETFHVGRVAKDRQVDLLCREHHERDLFYVEDTPAHLAAMADLPHEGLQLVLAERPEPAKTDDELRVLVTDTLNRAIQKIRG